jgi:hypothetical protein
VALPALAELFSIGQLVRCTVTGLRDGSSDDGGKKRADGKEAIGGGKKKRVDVSLRVSKMNGGLGVPPCLLRCHAAGCQQMPGLEGWIASWLDRCSIINSVSCAQHLQPASNAGIYALPPCLPDCLTAAGVESLREGLGLPACVRSVEDHGYVLALGIKVGRQGATGRQLGAKAARHACRPISGRWGQCSPAEMAGSSRTQSPIRRTCIAAFAACLIAGCQWLPAQEGG